MAMPQRAKIGVGDKLVWVWHKIWANHSHSSRKLIPLRWQKSMLWNRQRVESLTCGPGERAGNNGYKTTRWRAPLTVNMVLYTTSSKHRKQWRKRKRLRNIQKNGGTVNSSLMVNMVFIHRTVETEKQKQNKQKPSKHRKQCRKRKCLNSSSSSGDA